MSFSAGIELTTLRPKPILEKYPFWMCLPMADEMSDCPPGSKSDERPVATASTAMNELPTLQRNALRKIFDRPQFSPEEVAALGYRRLQQAEGIGVKGLSAIADWLQSHGHQLPLPPPTVGVPSDVPKKTRRTIEMALRLLRTHGYEVQQKAAPVSQRKGR